MRCIFFSFVDKRTDERDVAALIKIRCASNDRRLSRSPLNSEAPRHESARLQRGGWFDTGPRTRRSHISCVYFAYTYLYKVWARGPLLRPRRSSRSDTARRFLLTPVGYGPFKIWNAVTAKICRKSVQCSQTAGYAAGERKPVNWKRGDRVSSRRNRPAPARASALSFRLGNPAGLSSLPEPLPGPCPLGVPPHRTLWGNNLDSPRKPQRADDHRRCDDRRWDPAHVHRRCNRFPVNAASRSPKGISIYWIRMTRQVDWRDRAGERVATKSHSARRIAKPCSR